MNIEDLTVCIRSSGEFTTKRLLKDLAYQIGSNKKIHLIEDLTLHNAIDQSFAYALQDKSTWLITIDADLVIKSNFLDIFSKIANSMKVKEIEAHAMTVDRLFMKYRSAGNRLYRVETIPILRQLLKKTKNNIRPEGTMLREAVKLGYKLKPINQVVALHDFFQYSRDLFRKGYLCSFKHSQNSSEYLSTWRYLAKDSIDFSILLRGFSFGLISGDKPTEDFRSGIFKAHCDDLSSEFKEYDQSLHITNNIEKYIQEVTDKEYFNSNNPGLIMKLIKFMNWRYFAKK